MVSLRLQIVEIRSPSRSPPDGLVLHTETLKQSQHDTPTFQDITSVSPRRDIMHIDLHRCRLLNEVHSNH